MFGFMSFVVVLAVFFSFFLGLSLARSKLALPVSLLFIAAAIYFLHTAAASHLPFQESLEPGLLGMWNVLNGFLVLWMRYDEGARYALEQTFVQWLE